MVDCNDVSKDNSDWKGFLSGPRLIDGLGAKASSDEAIILIEGKLSKVAK